MNKQRRAKIRDAINYLDVAFDIIHDVTDGEGYAMDNTPENLQDTERYYQMEEAMDYLSEAADYIASAKESAEAALG